VRPHSLRLRLLLLSALAIVVALSVAGLVLTSLFAQHIESETARRLGNDLNRLAALIDAEQPALALSQPMTDPRFEVPYGGIYWQVRDAASDATLRSRSIWDRTLTAPRVLSANAPEVFSLTDPEGAPATAVGRLLAFELDNGSIRPLELIVAEDDSASQAAIASYRVELFRALLVLAVILVLAAWAQVTLGLAPLNAVRRGVSAIRSGEARALSGDFPTEILPLVNEVNELTDAQELSIQFARERAADLAHGLKGQLQVLNATAHEVRTKGDAASAAAIEELTTEMASTIDHQLGLSRLRRRSPNRTGGSDLGDAANKMVRTMQKTTRGGSLEWDLDIAPETYVALDGPDLAELMGALLENASKLANAKVRVAATREGRSVVARVEDDGPGMSEAQIETLGKRGVRLDEDRSGSGIGISIVREIVALNEGHLAFSRSPLGGLAVKVTLPAGAPRPVTIS